MAARGFTLVELMIGLLLAMVGAAAIHQLLLISFGLSRVQTEHAGLQDNVRAGALIVAHELRELGFDSVPAAAALSVSPTSSSDILVAQPGRIRYRAFRGFGVTCSPATAGEIRLRASAYVGLRQPVAGVDSLSLFVEGDPLLAEDDAWVRAGVSAVAPGSCSDGTPAMSLLMSWPSMALGAAAAAGVVIGGPVRVFEIMELQYYAQGGQSWLGMRSVSRGEAIQPLVGPLADSAARARGLSLGYRDRDDTPTAALGEVRSITIALHGVTAQPPRPLGRRPAVDSFAITTRVALRNMVRP